MMCQLAKVLLLCGVLCGLCSPAQANTTAPVMAESYSAPQAVMPPAAEVPPSGIIDEVFSSMKPVRIVLLLPLPSDALGEAADAVRAGFMAAYERDRDGISVEVSRIGDTPAQVLAGYDAARLQHDIIVGPLSRSAVTTVARSAAVDKPTIALNALDSPDGIALQLPPHMLTMGLSIDAEARQAADWASAEHVAGKAYIVFTDTPWQRRAAQAFAAQWQHLGLESESIEVGTLDGYLDWQPLAQLKKRIRQDESALLFAALDTWEARQLREAVGSDIPLYGTSQLNPFTLSDRDTAEPVPGMDGVRLLDMPWQLQPDDPAVMTYPRPVPDADRKPSADMARLYALGIDACRVAREIAARHTDFALDGVTGNLSVYFDPAGAHFERTAQHAVYQDGRVVSVAEP